MTSLQTGFLDKRGENTTSTKHRYFELLSDGEVTYAEKADSKKKKGSFNVMSASNVHIDHSDEHTPLLVVTPDRTWWLNGSEEDKLAWLVAFLEVRTDAKWLESAQEGVDVIKFHHKGGSAKRSLVLKDDELIWGQKATHRATVANLASIQWGEWDPTEVVTAAGKPQEPKAKKAGKKKKKKGLKKKMGSLLRKMTGKKKKKKQQPTDEDGDAIDESESDSSDDDEPTPSVNPPELFLSLVFGARSVDIRFETKEQAKLFHTELIKLRELCRQKQNLDDSAEDTTTTTTTTATANTTEQKPESSDQNDEAVAEEANQPQDKE